MQFIDGRRHSLRYAEADSHGSACLADQRDFAVAVRAWWSMPLVCSRAGSCPELQFIIVVVYTPVVALSLSHGPDCSLDLGFPSCSHGSRRPCLQVEQVHFPVVAQRQVPWSKLFV